MGGWLVTGSSRAPICSMHEQQVATTQQAAFLSTAKQQLTAERQVSANLHSPWGATAKPLTGSGPSSCRTRRLEPLAAVGTARPAPHRCPQHPLQLMGRRWTVWLVALKTGAGTSFESAEGWCSLPGGMSWSGSEGSTCSPGGGRSLLPGRAPELGGRKAVCCCMRASKSLRCMVASGLRASGT